MEFDHDAGGPDAASAAAETPETDALATDGQEQAADDDEGGRPTNNPATAPDAGGAGDDTSPAATEPAQSSGVPLGADAGAADDAAEPEPTASAPDDSDATPSAESDAAAAPTEPNGTTEPSGTTEPNPFITADPLFARDGIARFELSIGDAGVEALQADPFTYVEGDVEVQLADGTAISLPKVGVRQKGFIGSRRELFDKPSFLIKTNEYVKGQELLGMKKLALNNMVQDRSAIHEQISYDLFRSLDVPAPRTSYARVTLNGGPVALYASVEVIDNKGFLQTWFGDDEGNLYEGEYGVDVVPASVASFDLDRGADVAFADLQELATAIEAMTDPNTLLGDLGQHIDLERYLRFVAAERFMSHWDGYAEGRNNYFLYRAPGGLWTWLPWGTDQTFEQLDAPIWHQAAVLQQKCEAAQPCRDKFAEAFEQVFAKVTELDLIGRCDELEALIQEALTEDTLLERTVDDTLAAIEEAREFLRQRAARVEDQLACVDPAAVDNDADGVSGCDFDCNDEDPLIYSGAPERCNLIDDNCNGQPDDDPMCPSCLETANEGEPHYAFCYLERTWADATNDCIERGGRLVSVHSQEQSDAIRGAAASILDGNWWIGLNDQAQEANFVWDDQTSVDYLNWGEGEPNNSGESEHCAHMRADGFWNDAGCGATLNYICLLP